MNVSILSPSCLPMIAIGNDTLGIAEALRDLGCGVNIYANDWEAAPDGSVRSPNMFRAERSVSGDGILIYQHAIGWPAGLRLFEMSNTLKIVRYHSITPSDYFEKYSPLHRAACDLGRKMTLSLVQERHNLYLPVSKYSEQELIAVGVESRQCYIVPPFHGLERLTATVPDMSRWSCPHISKTTILYVAAFRPHKGHLRALRIFDRFRQFSCPPARLVLAGTTDSGLDSYVQRVQSEIDLLNLSEHVIMAMNITLQELHGLYLSANALLCMSEHEGFCVPLVEAMYFGVPVIAGGQAAVAETIGDAGIVIYEGTDAQYAAALADVVQKRRVAQGMKNAGRCRYEEHFRSSDLRKRFADIMLKSGCSTNF